MRGKLWFIGGLAAGFVLGARAGREKYEELMMRGRKFLEHPTVQEATGVAQAQVNRLYAEGKDRLSHTKMGEKMTSGNAGKSMKSADEPLAGSTASTGGRGSTGGGKPSGSAF